MTSEDPLLSIIERLDALSLHDYELLLFAVATRLMSLDLLAGNLVQNAADVIHRRRPTRFSEHGE